MVPGTYHKPSSNGHYEQKNMMLPLISRESVRKATSRLFDEVGIKNIGIEERGRNKEYT